MTITHASSHHTATFHIDQTQQPSDFRFALGHGDRFVDPEEITAYWSCDTDGDWTLDKITARGRLWRKTGGLGNATTVTLPGVGLPHDWANMVRQHAPTAR